MHDLQVQQAHPEVHDLIIDHDILIQQFPQVLCRNEWEGKILWHFQQHLRVWYSKFTCELQQVFSI